MPHQRTVIRHALTERLKQYLPELLRDCVTRTRSTPIRKKQGAVTMIGVYANSEQVKEDTSRNYPREPVRILKLQVECLSNADDVDDALDELARLVEAVVDLDLTLGGPCQDMRLTGTDLEFDDSGERVLGSAILSYDCEYQAPPNTQDAELVWFNRAGMTYDLAGEQAEDDRTEDLLTIRQGSAGPPPETP
jgi:hypothetical protein